MKPACLASNTNSATAPEKQSSTGTGAGVGACFSWCDGAPLPEPNSKKRSVAGVTGAAFSISGDGTGTDLAGGNEDFLSSSKKQKTDTNTKPTTTTDNHISASQSASFNKTDDVTTEIAQQLFKKRKAYAHYSNMHYNLNTPYLNPWLAVGIWWRPYC